MDTTRNTKWDKKSREDRTLKYSSGSAMAVAARLVSTVTWVPYGDAATATRRRTLARARSCPNSTRPGTANQPMNLRVESEGLGGVVARQMLQEAYFGVQGAGSTRTVAGHSASNNKHVGAPTLRRQGSSGRWRAP